MIRTLANRFDLSRGAHSDRTIRVLASRENVEPLILRAFFAYLTPCAIVAWFLHRTHAGNTVTYCMLVLIAAAGLWFRWQRYRWKAIELVFTPTQVSASSEGIKAWEVRYDAIHRIRCQKDHRWLVIDHAEGSEVLEYYADLGSNSLLHALGRIRRFNRAIVFDIEQTIWSDPLHLWELDQAYDVAPVRMKPGITYRYRYPNSVMGGYGRLIVSNAVFWIPQLRFLIATPESRLWILAMTVYMIAQGQSYWRLNELYRSREDRFRLTSSGLVVIRGKRKWLVRNGYPFRLRGWRPNLGGSIVRYKGKLTSYYFDPRLIVEDK